LIDASSARSTRLASARRLRLRPATAAGLPAPLPAELFGLLVGHVENNRPFACVIESNRYLSAFALSDLRTRQIRYENALPCHSPASKFRGCKSSSFRQNGSVRL